MTESSYPTQDELIGADPVFEWVDRYFIRRDPFAFQRADFGEFIFTCSSAFGIDPNGVILTGSGAVGLSLNPDKILEGSLKQFGPDSDLDVALISEVHFERAWRNLREQAHPALVNEMEGDLNRSLTLQKRRFFDGAILTNRLLPYLDFGVDWQGSHVRVAEAAARALDREVDVNYWVFRDYWSVRSYVANGIITCRRKLS